MTTKVQLQKKKSPGHYPQGALQQAELISSHKLTLTKVNQS
jgi:hypothetical protein